jgi:hypothetical protein
MLRPRPLATRRRGGLVVVLVAGALISLTSGCGSAAQPASPRASGPTGVAAQKLQAYGCSAEVSTARPHEVRHCEFELRDGRRFNCNMASFQASAPTAGEVAASKSCVALGPAASASVIKAIAEAQTCLTSRGLEVKGGPVPPAGHAPGGPEGELIIGEALIAFYPSPRSAKQAEPEVLRNARAFGGKPERRGAVTLLWIRQPPNDLRAKVLACVFT